MTRRRLATATSDFGSGKRESHDWTSFYERFTPPVVSGDERVAAIETGRRYVGFDTEPAYIELAKQRIAETT